MKHEQKNTLKPHTLNNRSWKFFLIVGMSLGIAGLAAPLYFNREIASAVPAKIASTQKLQIKNWGISNATGNAHIHAVEAWNIEQGKKDILVAVIDTGLDNSHRDLIANTWQGKDQKEFGWDFTSNTKNPRDQHGHGTHVAGIIGAMTNPAAGVSGVAKNVSIMAVKYYSETATGAVNLNNTVKAINYAIDQGARIINYSGGGPEFSDAEYSAIKRAEEKGILFVAAAGNEHQDTDERKNYYYPAAYGLSNIITVAATNRQNNLLASSNWGKTKVDVAAPGESIYSTLPGNRYGYMSGTSQATAFVSGLAALMLSKNPRLTPSQIREAIKKSVDPLPSLAGKVAAGGKVNAYAALLAITEQSKDQPKENRSEPQRVAKTVIKTSPREAIVKPMGLTDFFDIQDTQN